MGEIQTRLMNMLDYKLRITKDKLTSRGGLVLVDTINRQIGLTNKIDQHFKKPGSNRGFQPSSFVYSLLLMFLEGGQCLDDLKHIRQDQALRSVLGLGKVPSSDTMGDWLRRQGQHGVLAASEVNRLLLATGLKNCKKVTLDMDATLCQSRNKEAEWTYKKCKGYMPMIGHIAETGQIVHVDFRKGNVPPSKGNLDFMHQCEAALPDGVEVSMLRIDAAGYQEKIIEECLDRKIHFAIRARMCKTLKSSIEAQPESVWQPLINREGKAVEGCSTLRLAHTMDKSSKSFELIVQRQVIEGQQELPLDPLPNQESLISGKYMYRAIAVYGPKDRNNSEWIHWYNQRGECSENRIKELKEDFAAGRLPCKDFDANALCFALSSLAYNFFALLRMYLPSCFESSRAKAIRYRIFAIAGKVVLHGRTMYLKVQSEHHQLLQNLLGRLQQLAQAP